MTYSSLYTIDPGATLNTATFQPMGFNLEITSNSLAVLKAAETSFGWFGPARNNATPDFTFRLLTHQESGKPPGRPIFRREGEMIFHTAGPQATLVANLSQGQAFGYFSPAVVADQAYFRWHFLELALFQMLEASGFMGVHASALVKNDRAIMLRAPSGGGKSTLAYAGARGRFQALAEDVVWVAPQNGRWWGLPGSFHLLPDARSLFPELANYRPVVQTSGEMKLVLNLEQLRPASTVGVARPGKVVFVIRTPNQPSRLEAISARTAHTLWPLGQTGQESKLPHHPAIVKILLAQETYRLFYGDDLEQTLDLLESLF
jgi:hypothetical protein